MQFLRRPDYIIKSMPFTPIKARWGDYLENGVLHRYPSSLLDNSTSTDGMALDWINHVLPAMERCQWHSRRYQLLQLDLQAEALVDESNAFLILNNLASNATAVTINEFGIDAANVESVETAPIP